MCVSPFVTVWVCTPLKPGFTPRFEYARASSRLLGHVHLENLAVRCWTSVYIPFGAHLSPYAWLYAPARVCASPFVTVWVCTPLKPGFTPRFEYARARWGMYAMKTGLYAAVRVPRKPGCTPLRVCTRSRSCSFGPVHPGNLALHSVCTCPF